jgi:predicted MFS family arabinose efflux permease
MSQSFTSYEKTVIALLAVTQFTCILDFMVMSPLGDLLMKSINITPAQFGIAVSSYAFSAGISGLLAAGFADKFDRKRILLFFYTGFILGTFLCSVAPDYPTLVAARIITGLFGGVIGSVSMAIMTDVIDFSKRGRAMGIIQMGFGASQVLGIPIGLYFANLWGWHAPFLMVVILAVTVALFILIKLRPVTAHLESQSDRNAFAHLRHTVSVPAYQLAFSATALLSIGGFMLMPFGSAYLVNNVGISQAQLPIIFMVSGVCSLIVMPLIGKLSDKMDKLRLFAIGSAWAMVWVIIYTNIPPIPLWTVIIINVLMMIGIMSRMVPSMAIMSAVPSMSDRGAFMSINSSLQQIAGGVAAVVAGMIVVQPTKASPLQHYDILGYIVSVVVIFCVFMMRRVTRAAARAVKITHEPVLESPV